MPAGTFALFISAFPINGTRDWFILMRPRVLFGDTPKIVETDSYFGYVPITLKNQQPPIQDVKSIVIPTLVLRLMLWLFDRKRQSWEAFLFGMTDRGVFLQSAECWYGAFLARGANWTLLAWLTSDLDGFCCFFQPSWHAFWKKRELEVNGFDSTWASRLSINVLLIRAWRGGRLTCGSTART